MANHIEFELKGNLVDLLWRILHLVSMEHLGRVPGVVYGYEELWKTLDDCRLHPPDVDLEDLPRNFDLLSYTRKNKLTENLFPARGVVTFSISRQATLVLKAFLKEAPTILTSGGLSGFRELCETLRLKDWFKKNFDKPIPVSDDDVDFDDERAESDEANELKDVDKPEKASKSKDEGKEAEAVD